MRSRREDRAHRDYEDMLYRTESTSMEKEEREDESGEVEACFSGTDFQPYVTDEAMCG